MFLKQIDLYGTECKLNTFGKTKYKTFFGAFNTIISFIIFAVIFYLFGKDFLYKTHPKIISSEQNPTESDPVFINNSNFTIAWRVEDEDENPLNDQERVVWPVAEYFIYKKNEEKEFDLLFEQRFKPKPCSETSVTENKDFTSQDLSTVECVDLDEIKEAVNEKLGTDTDLPLWGSWDENYVAYLYLEFSACKFNFDEGEYFDCLSFEETQKRLELDNYVSFYLPRFTFMPESLESPLNIYYESLYYKVNPFSELAEIYKYSLVSLEDDQGWIFEDTKVSKAFERTGLTRNFNFLQKEAYNQKGKAIMFMADFLFARKQLVYKRNFVKIQEIIANVGGLMQVVYVFFCIVSQEYGSFKRNKVLIKRYFFSRSEAQNIRSMHSNNLSSDNLTQKVLKKRRNINFLAYFFSKRLCCSSKEKRKYLQVDDKVNNMVDLEEIVKLNMKTDYLCNNLLSQQRREDLNSKLNKIAENGLEEGKRKKRTNLQSNMRNRVFQFRNTNQTELK